MGLKLTLRIAQLLDLPVVHVHLQTSPLAGDGGDVPDDDESTLCERLTHGRLGFG